MSTRRSCFSCVGIPSQAPGCRPTFRGSAKMVQRCDLRGYHLKGDQRLAVLVLVLEDLDGQVLSVHVVRRAEQFPRVLVAAAAARPVLIAVAAAACRCPRLASSSPSPSPRDRCCLASTAASSPTARPTAPTARRCAAPAVPVLVVVEARRVAVLARPLGVRRVLLVVQVVVAALVLHLPCAHAPLAAPRRHVPPSPPGSPPSPPLPLPCPFHPLLLPPPSRRPAPLLRDVSSATRCVWYSTKLLSALGVSWCCTSLSVSSKSRGVCCCSATWPRSFPRSCPRRRGLLLLRGFAPQLVVLHVHQLERHAVGARADLGARTPLESVLPLALPTPCRSSRRGAGSRSRSYRAT